LIHNIENEDLAVQVNGNGAELWSLRDRITGTEHIWQGDPGIWPRRSPIIFPVCVRLKGEKLRLDGREYHMPLHGFARDYEHALVERSSSSLRLRMTENDETMAMYPFRFRLDSLFTLDETALTHSFEVVNMSETVMPFSIGYHTGYRCPFDERHTAEDYSLIFEKEETADRLVTRELVVTDEVPYLRGEREIKIHEGLFQPNLAFTNLKSGFVRLTERDTKRAVKVDFDGFPALVLWSVQGRVPFVCIEPWHGLFEPAQDYGDFREKPFVRQLAPSGTFTCAQRITIERA
jgi:galactose mutarotase-like enzyme